MRHSKVKTDKQQYKMKQLFLTIILGLSVSLAFTSCNNDKTKVAVEEEDYQVTKKNFGGDSTSAIAMAFYNQDSIATQFRFYKEVDSLLKSKENEYRKELEKKYRAYQNYEADIQARMERNEITGYQIEEIQKTAMQKQQAIQQFEMQKGEELQKETLQYQLALMNKISEAGKQFSEKRGIDLLFFFQKGGQITYINNAYDVTEEFIRYLNKREGELKQGFEEELEALENEPTVDKGGLK